MSFASKAQSAAQLSDKEFQEALRKQQEAYVKPQGPSPSPNPNSSATGSSQQSSASNTSKTNKQTSNITVKRTGGGKTWEDPSLLEWDPSHFRLFVGNLSGEVTDDMLAKAFAKYDSVSKVRVVINPKTGLGKGFAFISFKSSDDYFKAYKEMNGKYVGNHPIQLKRATTEIKPQAKTSRHGNSNHSNSNRSHKFHGRKPYDRK